MLVKMERKGKDVTCGEVWCPILGICALHLTHPSAHTQQWVVNTHTHTVNTHTPGAVGSQCCGARGAVGGSVPCSRVSPGIEGGESTGHSLPHLQSLLYLRLEPSGNKSDSLIIRPRLSPQHPLKPKAQKLFKIHLYIHLIMILWNFIQLPSLKINVLLNI